MRGCKKTTPPSSSGTLLTLPRTRADCSVSSALLRRLQSAYPRGPAHLEDPEACEEDCVRLLPPCSNHSPPAEGCGPSGPIPDATKKFLPFRCWPPQEGQGATLTLMTSCLKHILFCTALQNCILYIFIIFCICLFFIL